MKIIQTSTEDKKIIYRMTQGAGIKRISDAVGKEITVRAYVLYDDQKQDGSVVRVLSIMDEDGSIYATNSGTVQQSFADIDEINEGIVGEVVEVCSGIAKSGRTYYDLCWK